MADHLELQGGVYHVRLAIPPAVQKAFGGRRILSQTLRTGSRKEAMTRRHPILAAWQAQIDAARAGRPLPPDWQDSFAETLATAALITRANKMVSIGEEPSYPLPMPDPTEVALSMEENPALVQALKAKIAKAHQTPMGLIKFDEEMGEMFKRLMVHRLETAYTPSPEQREEIRAVAADPKNRKPRSPITNTRLAKFREHREAHGIAPKTIAQQEAKLQDLSQHLADTGAPLDFDTVTAWLNLKTVASKTKQQYLLAGSMFWQWSVKYDPQWRADYKGHDNPFEKHSLPQLRGKAKKAAERDVFTSGEIANLLAGAEEQGNTGLADLILLGTYSGMRIEEICQLQVDNIINVDGIRSFDITDSKTAAGIRTVPIHPTLFPVVDRLVQESTDGFLIKSDSKNKYLIRSDKLSKAFGKLKTQQGFGKLHVFHSLRATLVTELYRAYVPEWIVKCIVGHEGGNVTRDSYNQGASPQQKLDALLKLPAIDK